MQRVATAVGLLGLAAAFGGLAVGELVVAPAMAAQVNLIDANLAKTLTAPLHLRCTEIVLVGTLLLALATPRWIASRVATTLALVALGCAAVSRMVLVPRLYEAWSQVDLVAGRPADRIAAAHELADHATLVAATTAGLLVMLIGLVAWPRAASATATATRPAAEPVVGASAPA